jgi:L-lactate dehydrogenase complex protein LldF
MSKELHQSVEAALADPNLRDALGRFSEAYRISRAKAYEGMDFEQVRTRIAEVKGHAAAHHQELAEEFARNAQAAGAKVFRASSPEQVKTYIVELARRAGVRSIVKSKSMASEEIHLNRCLEGNGIEVSETDLGEWIIQLAGQRPSHMVMPAIHMTRGEVADVFSNKVESGQTPDIPKLVKFARAKLRSKFLNADMGITGANIAIAETGSLVLLTNEGNARLVTTLPKIHVAIVGIEKLVSRYEDIAPILKALPRSATAQLMTSYVSIITGPSPAPGGAAKELHIILVDNGRSKMAADPQFIEALQCIRCASCLNVCPVFRLVGGHVFGKVYTGGIGTILTAWFDGLRQSADIQSLCIQCGACRDYCPGKIDIPKLIMEVRQRVASEQGQPLLQKAIFSIVNNRRLFHSMLRAASVTQKPLEKDGFIRHLPMSLSGLTRFRSLPAIAEEPFRDRFKRIEQSKGLKEKAGFYAGCLIDFVYPEIGEAVVKVLNKAGIEVVFADQQTCCGAPARYSGEYKVAADNAVTNIDALLSEDVQYVVTACPTCAVALREQFATVLSSDNATYLARARQLSEITIDFSSLVRDLMAEGRLKLKPGVSLPLLTYHDSCHLKRSLRATDAPRELLTAAGYECKEMYESDVCCGMGGSYSLKMPQISGSMLQRKLENIAQTGAQIVGLDCPGCGLQIKGGLDKKGSSVRVRHTAEIMAEFVESVLE